MPDPQSQRLRMALFGAVNGAPREPAAATNGRVLSRSEAPIPKRTPSDLGHPNGKRTLSFGR